MKVGKIEVAKPENFEVYGRWLSRNLTAGVMLTAYPCPFCKSTIHTDTPGVGDVADSLTNCPVCDGLYYKIISNTAGDVIVETVVR